MAPSEERTAPADEQLLGQNVAGVVAVTGLGGSVATVTFLVWCETKTVIDVVVGAARVVGVRGVLGFGRTFGLGVVDGRDTVVGAAVVCAAVVRECPLQALTEATSTSAVIDHRPTRTTRCSHTRLRRAHRREAKPSVLPSKPCMPERALPSARLRGPPR
jgi:hypothetical protein